MPSKAVEAAARQKMWESGFGQYWDELVSKEPAEQAAEPDPPWKVNWPGGDVSSPSIETAAAKVKADAPAASAPAPAAAPAPASAPAETAAPVAERPPPTEGAIRVPLSPGSSSMATLARRALTGVLGPEGMVSGIQTIQEKESEIQDTYTKQREEIGPLLSRRHDEELATIQAVREYRDGLKAARPPQPTLQGYPAVPDLHIRPWLEPEGKNALSVIVQGLGALAEGVAGIALGAPKTALRLFRESAEAWRRDEVDTANSRLQQFETQVGKIRAENEQAIQIHDMADRERGANIVAKQALVISHLNEIGLTDAAIQAASLPYALSRESAEKQIAATKTIMDGIEKYQGVVARIRETAAKLPTTKAGLVGYAEQMRRNAAAAEDPEQKKLYESEAALADRALKRTVDLEQQGAKDKDLAVMAAREIPKVQNGLEQASLFKRRLESLYDAYERQGKRGLLPSNPTAFGTGPTAFYRRFRPDLWTPEAMEDERIIQQFFAPVAVGEARIFLGDIGRGSKEQYGPLADKIMPFPEARRVIKEWNDQVSQYEMVKRARLGVLSDIIGDSRLESAGQPPPEEPE